MSATSRILLGLIAGLGVGAMLSGVSAPAAGYVVQIAEPLGVLWVNGLRMAVLPMVVALIVVCIGSTTGARSVGRLGRNSLLLSVAMLVGAAIVAMIVVPLLVQMIPLSEASTQALRAQVAQSSAETPARIGFADWLTSLIPANPIKAAADGALLPLVIFSIFLGIALIRVNEDRRNAVLMVFRGIADAMLVIVRWMLELAPFGVFALAVPLAARMGLAAAGALAYYTAAVAVVCIVLMVLATIAAVVFGRVGLRAFMRTAAPAQAVAFSSRSSLASFPALVTGAERLGLSGAVTSFFLPLAVATFRLGAVQAMLIGALFLARLYGIDVGVPQIIGIALTSVLLSFSVPGIPGGSIIVITPILASLGVPAAGVGILLAIDPVTDMFRTMTNVTGDYAAATILSRLETSKS
jgi:Na+/H+-dicarboxylate symporter